MLRFFTVAQRTLGLAECGLFEADANAMHKVFARCARIRTIGLTEEDARLRATAVVTRASGMANLPNLLAQYGARLRFSKFDAARTINAANRPTAGQSYR